MKRNVFKWFIDYEKEEKWINEMAAKGLHMVDMEPFKYIFEVGEPDEYQYRIELLGFSPGSAEGIKYIRFLEETGVEHFTSWHRWVYLRKKTSDGTFDLFSDIDTKISHYKRIIWLYGLGLAICLIGGLPNAVNAIESQQYTLLAANGVPLVVAVLLIVVICKTISKIKRLGKEKLLRE